MRVCQQCGKEFAALQNLKQHQERVCCQQTCNVCDETFENKKALSLHKQVEHLRKCTVCFKTFSSVRNKTNHEISCSEKQRKKLIQTEIICAPEASSSNTDEYELCDICGVSYIKRCRASHLLSNVHRNCCYTQVDNANNISCWLYKTALKNNLNEFKIEIAESETTLLPDEYFDKVKHCILKALDDERDKRQNLKFRLKIIGEYMIGQDEQQRQMTFYSKFEELMLSDNLEEKYQSALKEIIKETSEFEANKSGWGFLKVIAVFLQCAKVRYFRASSFLKLPKEIAIKNACTNIKNTRDDQCFIYSLLANRFRKTLPLKSQSDPEKYLQYFKKLKGLDKLNFPLDTTDIKKFEKFNPKYSFSVFGLGKKKEVYGPLYKSKSIQKYHCNLLYLEGNETNHYVLINSLNTLVKPLNGKAMHFCHTCLTSFRKRSALNLHQEIGCLNVKVCNTKEPSLTFKNVRAMEMCPFAIYFDFESVLQKYENVVPSVQNSFTMKENIHLPLSFAYQVVSNQLTDARFEEIRIYRGEDCVEKFIDMINEDVSYINETYFLKPKKMETITSEIRERLGKQEICSICKIKFNDKDTKVIDHSHLTGCVRSYLHNSCNLKFQQQTFIPLLGHNTGRYDNSHLMRPLAARKYRMSCLGRNKTTYVSFSYYPKLKNQKSVQIRVLDTYQFLAYSLQKLSVIMKNCERVEKFHKQIFPNGNIPLLVGKSVMCYDYVDSYERLKETEWPSIDKFFNTLTNKSITREEYEHGKLIFDNLPGEKSLGNYYDFYLQLERAAY